MSYKTAFDLCGNSDWEMEHGFKIKGGTSIYESAVYSDRADKVKISKITDSSKGKNFLLGLGFITRYISPDTKIELVKHKEN